MKESRKIIILAGLLTLTVACCVLLSFPGRGESEGTSEEMPVVTAVSAGDVRAVALINETGSIGLLNLPEGIAVDGADAAEYSQSKLITIVYSLSHLKAQRAFAAPEDQAEKDVYGFSEPSAQVSLLLEDTTIRLVLGRRSPVSGEHYLKVEGDPAVYMVDEEISEMMLQSVSDLRDLSMYPALTQETLKRDNTGEGGLAHARRPPEDHGRDLVLVDQLAQDLPLSKQMLLPHKIIQRLRPQPAG